MRAADRASDKARLGLLILAAASGALTLLVAAYVGLSQVNHTGFPLLRLMPVGLLGMVSGFLMRRRHPRAAGLGFAMGLLLCGTLLALDHCNHMVEYERWLKRGMPASCWP